MTDADYARKLDELDRLLNDPDVPMEPAKVWSLLAEIAQHDSGEPPCRAQPRPDALSRPFRARSGTRGCPRVR